jgi:hypothetical protein
MKEPLCDGNTVALYTGTPDFLFYIRDPHIKDIDMMELVS